MDDKTLHNFHESSISVDHEEINQASYCKRFIQELIQFRSIPCMINVKSI